MISAVVAPIQEIITSVGISRCSHMRRAVYATTRVLHATSCHLTHLSAAFPSSDRRSFSASILLTTLSAWAALARRSRSSLEHSTLTSSKWALSMGKMFALLCAEPMRSIASCVPFGDLLPRWSALSQPKVFHPMAHGGYGYVEYVRHLTDATIARPEFRYDLCRHEERGGKRVRPYLLGVCPSRREGAPSLNDPSNLPVS